MRGDAAPADDAGHAERVERAGIVVGDALRQEGCFPLDGGGFEAFELAERVEHAFFAGELGLRREVLPAEEPVHVLRGGDGLDLLAQGVEGALVDALEEAAFAPLNLIPLLAEAPAARLLGTHPLVAHSGGVAAPGCDSGWLHCRSLAHRRLR